MFTKADLKRIHHYSFCNETQCNDSTNVGCFHCGEIFPASEITEYCTEQHSDEGTAICPKCWVDAILPDTMIELTAEMMLAMYNQYFVRRECNDLN